ncbi:MAG: hypothetical protein HN341_14455 [Verrucomicrobia bacterium]|nr:hypothetical protein [Verrucomicrobiota bacterium]
MDKAITNMAIRYTNTLFIAEQLAPVITVTKQSDKYFIYDKAYWFMDDADDDRAPGTRAPRSGYKLSTGDYLLKEIAHATPVPWKIADNADDPLRMYEDASAYSMQMCLLRRERRTATDLFATGKWATDVTGGTDFTKWSDFADSDPANDIATGQDAIQQNTGQLPNTLVIGWEVWQQLRQHPDGLDRYKHTQTGILTPEMVAQWLDIDRLIIGRAIYNSAREGQTASMSYIWGKDALLSFVTSAPSRTEASAAYIFQKGDIETRRFVEEPEKQDVVEVTLETDPRVTASDAGYFFSGAVA